MTETRTYVVSLPVAITVTGETVTYDIDTSEAAEAVAEDEAHLYYEGDLAEDVAAIEADHARRQERPPAERDYYVLYRVTWQPGQDGDDAPMDRDHSLTWRDERITGYGIVDIGSADVIRAAVHG